MPSLWLNPLYCHRDLHRVDRRQRQMCIRDRKVFKTFKARLDKFWQQQLVNFDFTADLTGTGNRSEVIK